MFMWEHPNVLYLVPRASTGWKLSKRIFVQTAATSLSNFNWIQFNFIYVKLKTLCGSMRNTSYNLTLKFCLYFFLHIFHVQFIVFSKFEKFSTLRKVDYYKYYDLQEICYGSIKNCNKLSATVRYQTSSTHLSINYN